MTKKVSTVLHSKALKVGGIVTGAVAVLGGACYGFYRFVTTRKKAAKPAAKKSAK